jgi:hypothetical protein
VSEIKLSARVKAFLDALPHAHEDEFVNAPGLGTFRAKYIRRGLEREVVAVHSTGQGLAIIVPPTHGACADCKGGRGKQLCEHCSCAMCTWFRQSDERASPRVSPEKLRELTRRLKAFEFAAASQPATVAALDDDLI